MADITLVAAIRREVEADEEFARDALLELVGTPSVGPYERDAQRRLVALASSSGLDVEMVPIPTGELLASERYVDTGNGYEDRPNVVVRIEGGPGGAVIINSHIDTVRESAGWTHVAQGEVVGDRVFGLGSADAKGSLVAALVAARAIARLGIRLPGDLVIQSVIDEEGSGNGSLGAVLAMQPGPIRLVVVMEPTDLQAAYGHRGMLAVEVLCPGRSAHGAIGGGVNAIASAARVVTALEGLSPSLAEHGKAGYRPPSLNVGIISGGFEVYTTPDRCSVAFSVRYAPGQRDDLLAAVSDGLAALAEATPAGFAPRIESVRDFDAAETSPDDEAVRAFLETARLVRPSTGLTTLDGTCDARHFRNVLGVPTLVYGPGRLADAHAPEEHVELADVLAAAAVIATFATTA